MHFTNCPPVKAKENIALPQGKAVLQAVELTCAW
jgi:hypothetical protein